MNLHLENKGFAWLAFANKAMEGSNHNYLEIRDGRGEVFRRIQTQEVNMGIVGKMMGAVYGSKGTDFSEDEIYHDDPNENGHENMLRSGDVAEQTGDIYVGTKNQVLALYHQALVGVINGNNQNLSFNALWGDNGNTFTAEILEKMQEAAVAMEYLPVQDFNPKGSNPGFDKSIFNFRAGQQVCFTSDQELFDAIDILEAKVTEQVDILKKDDDYDLDTEIPITSTLSCTRDGPSR